MEGDDGDGRRLIDEALDAFHRDDRDASARAADAALALARERDDPRLEVEALTAQARLALRALDFPTMEALCRTALDAAERTGDPACRVMPLHMRAEATRLQGDPAGARPLYEQSLALNRELGDERMVGVELHNRAYVDLTEGQLEAAEQGFRDSMDITLRHTGGMRIPCIIGLGAVAATRGDGVRAVTLLAAGEAAMTAAGEVPDPADEPEFRQSIGRARTAAGPDADELWAAGAALSLDAAVELALLPPPEER